MRAAYFDCQSGASGNMLLGAFLDAGAPRDALDAAVKALGLSGDALVHVDRRARGDHDALHVEVEVTGTPPQRSVADIDRLIAAAPLDEGVRERSRLAFRLLAAAEARAHNVRADQVVLHETGAVDALIDVVGTFALAEAMGVETFYSSPLPYCVGETMSGHGVIPLPAPATVNILEAVGAPTLERDGTAELVTPTGAAIIAACATFETPAIVASADGYGAGTADLDWPNVLHLVVGDVETAPLGAVELPASGGLSEETVAVIETNIDDMAPNLLAEVPKAMLDAGAVEAFLTPVVMKKGRAGHVVTVICDPTQVQSLAELLLRETTTLGVRVREERRLVAIRRLQRVTTSLGALNVKVKELGGRVVDAAPELDDVKLLALAAGVPVAEAYRRAGEEARTQLMGQD